MQVTIQVPDYILEPIKDRLSPELIGMLEAVALEAILGRFDLLLDSTNTVGASSVAKAVTASALMQENLKRLVQRSDK